MGTQPEFLGSHQGQHQILVMCLSKGITTCNDHVQPKKKQQWAVAFLEDELLT
jgi:hypothetical protein